VLQPGFRGFLTFGVLCAVIGALLAGCSDDGADDAASTPSTAVPAQTPSTVQRPDGPASDLAQELTGGEGVFIGSALMGQLDPGYVEHEYVAAGSASSYTATSALKPDGRWAFTPGSPADYRTRIVVRRPEDPAKFSGVVLVEWLNVSGGVDADPDYVTTHEEISRQGHAWVGVSAQVLGVEGGPVLVRVDVPEADDVAGKGLKAIDAARYGSLDHPGDAYAYDIFTQVTRALRAGGPALGDRTPTHVIAMGESQSAAAMVTYVNGVQPMTKAFDGFFVHSRGAAGLPLAKPGGTADMSGAVTGVPTIVRTDAGVPVFEYQTEGDVTSILNSYAARQPDTASFRLWEVAGTAHADTRLLGANVSAIDCGVPVNDGPQHVVAKAALHHLVQWVTDGTLPPTSPRLEVVEATSPEITRDDDGIALGGVRTPLVDVPVRVVSGEQGPVDSVICLLLGSTKPLPASRIDALYRSRAEYEQKFASSADAAIKAGFVLEQDRALLDAYKHAELVPE
jgi:hypothetical protein